MLFHLVAAFDRDSNGYHFLKYTVVDEDNNFMCHENPASCLGILKRAGF